MALEGVVNSAGGLRIAQRGSCPPDDGTLRVEGVAAVTAPRAEPTEARRSDGVVWRRHWLDGGRLVVEFVEIAFVEVDQDCRTIIFDRHLQPDVEQHLLFDHVLPLLLACNGAVVVHGGVISLAHEGVVLLGPSGAGKSTLTAFAWKQGWTVGGDDGAVLSPSDPPTAEPTYATVRLTPRSVELLDLESEARSPVVGKMRVGDDADRRFRQGPVDLRLLARLEPADTLAEAALEPLSGVDAHVALFQSTFHAELRGHRLLPAVVEQLAAIVEATTVARLTVPFGLAGLAAAEQLLRSQLASRSAFYGRGPAGEAD